MMPTSRMTVRPAYHRTTRYTVRLMRFVPLLAVIVTGLAAYLSRGVLDQVPSSSGLMRVALLPPGRPSSGSSRWPQPACSGWIVVRYARASALGRHRRLRRGHLAGAGARRLDPAVSADGPRRVPRVPDPRRSRAGHRLDRGRRADRVGVVAIGHGGRGLGANDDAGALGHRGELRNAVRVRCRGRSPDGHGDLPGWRRTALPRHGAEPLARWRSEDRKQSRAARLPRVLQARSQA